jgi:hypothetical protein
MKMPVTLALAVGALALGILAGIALGPGPASSPADSAALAQRALAGLLAREGSGLRSGGLQDGGPQGSASTSAAPVAAPPNISEATPTPAAVSGAGHKESTPRSSKASGTSSGGSSSSETSRGTSSEGTSSEGKSSEGSPSEGSSKSSKSSGEAEKAAPGTPIKLPGIKHVWLITLSGESFANAIAQSQTDPYLAKRLVPKGTLLSDYTLTASSELANGIALLSGQGVNLNTEQSCPSYAEVQPPTINATNGLAEGVGCVYPHEVQTLADELTAGGLTWKAYVQDMEEDPPAPASSADGSQADATGTNSAASTSPTADPDSTVSTDPSADTSLTVSPSTPASTSTVTCRHPELGASDPNQAPSPGDPYITARNPFVYFHSLLDGGACASDDVELSELQQDLATPASTPNLSWIVPSACNDGSSTPCAPGAPAGLAAADAFLEEVVPQILATSAYRKQGLIVIVPDSAPSSPAGAATKPVGALLISPFVRDGARVGESLNDFSLAKSLARLFGVLPLGHANDPSTVSFGATVYRTTK